MINSTYDVKRGEYIIRISESELKNAFKSREAYRDFILKNFGFHLTLEDFEKVEVDE